jgi:hypothetical protein
MASGRWSRTPTAPSTSTCRQSRAGADKEANWLPAPVGSFNLTMSRYAPREAALDGTWAPPAIQKVG